MADDLPGRWLTPDDWQTYRDGRLVALQQSPECLGDFYKKDKGKLEQWWRDFLTEHPAFVVMKDDAVIGNINIGRILSPTSPAAVISNVWRDQQLRGQGIGDRLMTAAFEWAHQNGITQIFLKVFERCEDAEVLYCRHGFRREREGRLPDGRRVYEMALRFSDPA